MVGSLGCLLLQGPQCCAGLKAPGLRPPQVSLNIDSTKSSENCTRCLLDCHHLGVSRALSLQEQAEAPGRWLILVVNLTGFRINQEALPK